MYVPSSDQPDRLIWGLTADGEYSVKSGALLAQGLTPATFKKVEFRWIWSLSIPPKIKNFLWKACNDRLPSKTRLERSHIFLPQQCVFCNNASESVAHLCFACSFTLDVFAHLQACSNWPSPPACLAELNLSSFRSVFEACESLTSKNDILKFSFVWWFVWFFRNKVIFNDETSSSRKVSSVISSFFESWSAALSSEVVVSKLPQKGKGASKLVRSGPASYWSPPPPGWCKLNFD